MSADLTAEQLATLTPEEVAAITGEDEHSPDELAALQRLADQANGADDGDDGDDDDGDADTGHDTKPAPAAPATQTQTQQDADAAADVAQVAAQKAVAAEPAQPVYKAEMPAEFDSMVETIADQESELKRQFKEGDIDFEDYTAKQAELIAQRQTLNTQKIKAEISQEMSQQTAANNWQATVNRNIEDFAKEQGGIDYRKDESKQADLDQFVRILANKPENSAQSMDWFMQEAHKRVKALHGIADAPKSKGDTVADAAARRRQDSSGAPKTLAQVPGGDGPGDIGSKFAHLDSLEGEALEGAIASMTPAQRAAYAAE